MLVVPTIANPRQSLQAQLGGQACTITLYQLAYGMFVDLYVNDALVIGGVICENLNRVVRSAYLGFVGDLVFVDTQAPTGSEGTDPVYTGLGAQYQLVYLEEADLPAS
jgi:hypothetical protein